MTTFVATQVPGGPIITHLPSEGPGAMLTLCGTDVDCDDLDQPNLAQEAAWVNCRHCFAIWYVAHQYNRLHFTPEAELI